MCEDENRSAFFWGVLFFIILNIVIMVMRGWEVPRGQFTRGPSFSLSCLMMRDISSVCLSRWGNARKEIKRGWSAKLKEIWCQWCRWLADWGKIKNLEIGANGLLSVFVSLSGSNWMTSNPTSTNTKKMRWKNAGLIETDTYLCTSRAYEQDLDILQRHSFEQSEERTGKDRFRDDGAHQSSPTALRQQSS